MAAFRSSALAIEGILAISFVGDRCDSKHGSAVSGRSTATPDAAQQAFATCTLVGFSGGNGERLDFLNYASLFFVAGNFEIEVRLQIHPKFRGGTK